MVTRTVDRTGSGPRAAEYESTRQYMHRISGVLADAAVDVAWTQWAAMGTTAASRPNASSIIDPEALILVTLLVADREPRLLDLVHDWISVCSDLVSTQRIKNLAKAYPFGVQRRLGELADTAVERGKDARWKTLAERAGEDSVLQPRINKPRANRPALSNPALLLLRLRLAFGAGIKADTLGFLLGRNGDAETVRSAAIATGYTQSALRRAVDEMAAARILQTSGGQPLQYRVKSANWLITLELDEFPQWRDWAARFRICAAFLDIADGTRQRSLTRYALSTLLREKSDEHRAAFEQHHILNWYASPLSDDWDTILEDDVNSLAIAMRNEA